MLMRTDPFREFDRLVQQVFGSFGTVARPAVMLMDAWREGDDFVVQFDLPGVSPESIDLALQDNVLTVKAERPLPEQTRESLASERPHGVFTRQLFLAETLDTEHLSAQYEAGVLTLRIPVAEQAKPRKIEISTGTKERQAINA